MRFIHLFEAPIGDINFEGDWGPDAPRRGYDKPSIGILQSPAGIEKLRTKWAKIDQTFDLYFVRSSKGWKHAEVGEVPWGWPEENLGLDIRGDDDKIVIIYTNNKGAEKVPMTPWTLAHRFGHACQRGSWNRNDNPYNRIHSVLESTLTSIARIVYGATIGNSYGYNDNYARSEKIFRRICEGLGTMKSARDGNLRNWNEFIYEMLAQYMITGGVKLNTDLPKVLATGMAWGRKNGPTHHNLTPEQTEQVTDAIYGLQNAGDEYAYETLQRSVGKIFVM